MGQKCFFIHQIQQKVFVWSCHVIPQFVCSMKLIGTELLGTLEGYLSSATFDVYPVAERHQMVIGSLALPYFSLVFMGGGRAAAPIGDKVL